MEAMFDKICNRSFMHTRNYSYKIYIKYIYNKMHDSVTNVCKYTPKRREFTK